MTTYYSSFASGLQEVVRKALVQQLGSVKINLLLDGLIVYESDRPLQQIKRLRFFNNTFLLLHLFQGLRESSIPFMLNTVLRKTQLINIPHAAIKGNNFFRIMASKENQTVSINRDVLARLESFFSAKLGLKVHRSKPDIEVWFLERSEKYGFVGLRITQPATSEKNLQRGELKPELANLLCLISEPGKEDVFLDPFAGSGAIPIERARNFPYKQILASDNNKEIVNKLRSKASALRLKITITEGEALNLEALRDNSIDKIVTDPPWGLYTAQETPVLDKFYTGMLLEFSRILKEGGLVVLLMGQKELFEKIMIDFPKIRVINKYDILVSGKKASIYQLKKQPHLTITDQGNAREMA